MPIHVSCEIDSAGDLMGDLQSDVEGFGLPFRALKVASLSPEKEGSRIRSVYEWHEFGKQVMKRVCGELLILSEDRAVAQACASVGER